VPLVRALIKRPEIYVLDIEGLLSTSTDPTTLITRLRAHCEGKTLFLLLTHASLLEDADLTVSFEGARGTVVSCEAKSEETAMVTHEKTEMTSRKHDTGVVS
jgi:hypothetical protein